MNYNSSDDDALRLYEMREKALWDWTSGVNNARREGIQEGIKEGAREIARKALAKGATVEFISEITGLTERQIKDL